LLGRHECLVLDYNVPATAKDANGKPIGRSVLLKSFRARAQLEDSFSLSADGGEQLDLETIRERLAEEARRGRSNDHA
jgi:hypothetical protein